MPRPIGLRLDARDESAPRRGEDLALGGLRQHRRIVDDRRIAALRFDDSLKCSRGASRPDRLLQLAARGIEVGRGAGQHEHLGAKRVRDRHEVRRPFALERGDRLLDLERVAARAAERPIHRRDQRDAGQS